MARENYFQLNRSVQNHWVWRDKPFAKGQAWVDLLLLANYKDVKMPYKGEMITCKRGDVNLSITTLAERWGWSRCKTRNFLKELENDETVTVNATKHRTTITIDNYKEFQDAPTTDEKKDKKNTKNAQQNDFESHTTKSIEKDASTQHSQSTKSRPKVDQKSTKSQPLDITKKDKKDKKVKNNIKEIYKEKFGEFQNVLLTDTELVKLQNLLPDYEDFIERLSAYKESTGKKYKSDYATILNWSRKEKKESVDFLDL